MTDRPNAWMPLYIADYLADTMHLTAAQHGAYLLLIMEYWRTARPLPNDDVTLSRLARMPFRNWVQTKAAVLQFFDAAGQELRHKRIDAELAEASERYEKMRRRTEAASKARWLRNGQQNDTVTDTVTDTQPQPQPQPQRDRIEDAPRRIPTATQQNRGSRLPPDWAPDEPLREFASKLGLDPGAEAAAFRDHWQAATGKGATKLDWSAAWRTWCRRSVEFGGQRRPTKPNGTEPPVYTDEYGRPYDPFKFMDPDIVAMRKIVRST